MINLKSKSVCFSVPLNNLLQTKFGARCRAWNMAPYNSEATPCIAIRFEEEMTLPDNLGPILDRNEILK